jgi:asparagine synthase (glutamine-hydrolysing)
LSGVGGDELFAGYRKHVAHYWAQAYRKMPALARHLFEKSLLALPGMRGSALKGPVRMAKKMARGASLPPTDRFIMDSTYLNAHQKSALYTAELQSALCQNDPAVRHRASFERVQDADFLNQMLYLDSKIFMTSLNLTYNDKMSMASSVEVRVPFLDKELAEFVAWNVPPHLKLKGFLRPNTKYIFREAMKGILPNEVLHQPKAGFAAPVDYWLANDLRPMVDDLLSESQVRSRGLLRPESVYKFVKEHRSGAQDWSVQIWQFLTLELWMRTFLDGRARSSADENFHPRQVATA